MMNWKGFRRKEMLPNENTITAFAWRRGKPQETSAGIAKI
jgi:hypothetical protein